MGDKRFMWFSRGRGLVDAVGLLRAFRSKQRSHVKLPASVQDTAGAGVRRWGCRL